MYDVSLYHISKGDDVKVLSGAVGKPVTYKFYQCYKLQHAMM